MDFFGGLRFLGWGNCPRYDSYGDRMFEGYYGIQYNHSGPFQVIRDNEPPCNVTGPHLFISYPGVRLRYGAPAKQMRHHLFVCFQGERVARYLAGGLLEVGGGWGVVPVVHSAPFYQGMLELLRCLQDGAENPRAVHLLEGLLLQIHEQAAILRGPGRLAEPLDRLGQEIRRDPLRTWDFRTAAQEMNISYPHFRRVFQQHFTCAPARFLLRSRLEYAGGLLRESRLSIAQIAELAGFSDVYHFSRLFKRHLHLPPARYRREFTG